MSTFVLVHGAWHGAWCWNKVVPRLENKGHKVVAPDLPGHGKDKTPISAISLQSYTDHVCQILDVQPEPVVLVGHSLGGGIITQAAEYQSDKIRILVYLAAFLVCNGESMSQVLQGDKESLILPNLVLAKDQSHSMVEEKSLKHVFYDDCSDEDVALAKALLVPEPTAPSITPVHTTQHNFGQLPRVYIECLRDRALSPLVQKQMQETLPCQKVISMNTSHSPFFSAPEELATHLASLQSKR